MEGIVRNSIPRNLRYACSTLSANASPAAYQRQQIAGARRRRVADLPHETLRIHRWSSIPSSVRAGENIQPMLVWPPVSAHIGVGARAGGRTGGAGSAGAGAVAVAARWRGVGGISHQRELVEETFDRLGNRREPRLGSLLRRLHRRVRLRRHQFVVVVVVVAVVAFVVFVVFPSPASSFLLLLKTKSCGQFFNYSLPFRA